MKKAQLSIYLDPEIFNSLKAFAKRQGKPKSLVAEAAIASFLSPDDSDRREAAIAKRLDRIVRVLERLSAMTVLRLRRSPCSSVSGSHQHRRCRRIRALLHVRRAPSDTIVSSKVSDVGSPA